MAGAAAAEQGGAESPAALGWAAAAMALTFPSIFALLTTARRSRAAATVATALEGDHGIDRRPLAKRMDRGATSAALAAGALRSAHGAVSGFDRD